MIILKVIHLSKNFYLLRNHEIFIPNPFRVRKRRNNPRATASCVNETKILMEIDDRTFVK